MEGILLGLELLLQPTQLIYLVAGVTAGFAVGVLPGFQASNGAAIALPFAIGLPIEQALLLLIGIYAGASFSGSIPAILVNVPGTAGAAATAMDGYPLAQQGKAQMAIGLARMASTAGGVLAMVLIIFLIGPIADIALQFGAREMVLVVAFGILVIGALVGDNPVKGLLSATMGILFGTMGASIATGQTRLTFGFPELHDGIGIVPALIGLFAFAQMFDLAGKRSLLDAEALAATRRERAPTRLEALRREWLEIREGIVTTLRFPKTIVRSSLLGLLVGILPGGGAAVGNFLGWGAARRFSKNGENFGKGEPEGVVASEAADNAVNGGTLVPTLTLGVPGSATAAVVLAAIILHGIPPGPRAIVDYPGEIYALLLGALLASILILPIGILLAAPMTLVTRVPPKYLVPFILLIASIGVYASRNQFFDVGVALAFGVLGYFMLRHAYPAVPMILGLILGPLGEEYLVRALQLGQNRPGYFFDSTIALVLWAVLAVVVGAAVFRSRNRRKQIKQREPAT